MIKSNSSNLVLILLYFCFIILICSCENNSTEKTTYPTIGYLEKLHPGFDKIVNPNTKIEVIASGHSWTEGPVWIPSEQCLIYSDVPRNIAYRWTEKDGAKPYLEPSGYSSDVPRKGGIGSNGLTLDHQGKLLLCRSGDKEVARMEASFKNPKPIYKTLANQFEGEKFNSPNDLVVDKKGNIYFTDPNFGMTKDNMSKLKEMDYQGVFRISHQGKVKLLTKSLPTPNGIGLSPDGKKLYVANTRPPFLAAFDLSENGDATNQRIIFDAKEEWEKSIAKQEPDGMTVNKDGIIFMTGPDGVLLITREGKHLGTIKTEKRTSNCTFNEDETVLYVSCDDLMLRIDLKGNR